MNRSLKINSILSLLLLAGSLQLAPVLAAPLNEGNAPAGVQQAVDGGPQMQNQIQNQQAPKPAVDEQKLQTAKELTDWLNHTLQEKHALVAVVGRQGSNQTKKQDKTGMGHAGLAVYDPRAQSWIIYNLLNEAQGSDPKSSLWRTAPLDFFYGQKSDEKDALILIPDETTQQRMYEAILDGRYKKLFFTGNYNLLSAPASTASLNCNKWLLLNIVAARIDNYEPTSVLDMIRQGFEPGQIHLSPLERMMLKSKPTIRVGELPAFGPIETVTVESLYRSDMFTDKLFYSGRKL